jgi:hypothetical protein
MATIISNTASGRTGPRTGAGGVQRRSPFGQMTIAGKAGDSIRIPAADLFDKVVNGYVTYQLVSGSATLFTTLADAGLALDPEKDSGGHWSQEPPPVLGSITRFGTHTTAVRIDFTVASILYLVAL